jgi:dihydrofolate reductase
MAPAADSPTSTTLTEPLPWINSTLLAGDTADAVAKLKEQPGEDIGILGSGELVRSLMRHNLIDEYILLIHRLVLGSGRRLFADGSSFVKLRLTDSVTTTTAVVIATYQPAEPTQPRSLDT